MEPACAVSWSGGKDSAHALHRALGEGRRITHLFNIYEGSTGRVRFHGVRKELIAAQARALGLELVQAATGPDDFETVFLRTLDRLAGLGIGCVVFGNIHLEEIREWYESRTRERGFDHVEPLWGGDPARLVLDVLGFGYRCVVVSVDLERGDPSWVGRELTPELARRLIADPDVDPCGERGEYHTFVFGGPAFRHPLSVAAGEELEIEGHRLVDLTLRS